MTAPASVSSVAIVPIAARETFEALAQLLLGACTQAEMVIARSPNPKRTRRVVGKTLKALIDGLAPERSQRRG